MPYRFELRGGPPAVAERLIDAGAIDVEESADGHVVALMPDTVVPETLARALAVSRYSVSPAVGRDANSVWMLSPRPVHVGPLRLVPAETNGDPRTIKLIDAPAFGTGRHPTTALCLEAIVDHVDRVPTLSMLDVGTGSGVLALAALRMNVQRVTALDIDHVSLRVASSNARLNGLAERIALVCGGPDAVSGSWPLVVANVLAAPLIEMAPVLVRRLGHHGRLVLSGMPNGLEDDVAEAYVRLGLHRVERRTRAGWLALVFTASW